VAAVTPFTLQSGPVLTSLAKASSAAVGAAVNFNFFLSLLSPSFGFALDFLLCDDGADVSMCSFAVDCFVAIWSLLCGFVNC
jgi:hypothetical protein